MLDAVATICQHQSIRKYTGEKISQEQMEQIENAIIQTSSTCFLQFVTTIKIQDPAKLARLSELSKGQEHIAKCSHFLMFCLDLTKLMHFTNLQAPFSFKLVFAGLNDCSLACQNALTAAEDLGLGGVIIGGYKSGIAEVSEMLKLPEGVVPLLGLCLGVPDQDYVEEQKPRLPRHWLIMDEEYSDQFNQDELDTYDAQMQKYYENRRYNQRSETWTEGCVKMIEGQKSASHIISYLKQQGFDFF